MIMQFIMVTYNHMITFLLLLVFMMMIVQIPSSDDATSSDINSNVIAVQKRYRYIPPATATNTTADEEDLDDHEH
jgi:hypothetical protein